MATTITGTTGNDILNSINDDDVLKGLAGNDTYHIQDYQNVVVEAPNAGIDTVYFNSGFDFGPSGNYVTPDNVENLNASELTAGATINGNSLTNTLTGSNYADTLFGGDDNLKDALIGANGSDTYIIKNQYDLITEKGTGIGDVDVIQLDAEFDNSLKTPTVAAFALKDAAIEVIDGHLSNKALTLTGNTTTATTIIGGTGNDTINGGSKTDTLYGGAGNDTLYGGADTLADSLNGQAGNDSYTLATTKDTITEINDGSTNTIILNALFSETSLSLSESVAYNYTGSNISVIDASASSAKKVLTITGNATTTTTIIGSAGNDTINGGSAADTLSGGAGNDVLNGGGGLNKLDGGLGNDTYLTADNTSINTVVDAGGVDTVKLVADVNNKFNGNNNASFTINAGTLSTTIDNLDASKISASNMTLTGNGLVNTITASDANDTIDGGLGADTMIGGKGNDTYYVDSYLDVITEADTKTVNFGNDTAIMSPTFDFGAKKTYTLSNNVETLDLSGLALTPTQQTAFATTKATIYANASNNTIIANNANASYLKVFAGEGNDTFNGGTGDDYADGGGGNDTLYGNAGNDYLLGGLGDDYLEDTEGSNTLDGGAGNDTYHFDGAAATKIIDSAGVDTILTDGTITSLANYAMIENINASSSVTVGLNLTGSSLANTLYGGSGGANTLTGGLGNDTYVIQSNDDVAVELANEGTDTIKIVDPVTNVDLTLSANVENIDASAITFNAALDGNNVINTITGSNQNDTLYGGNDALKDTLIGGNGSDTYIIQDLADVITETGTGLSDIDTIQLKSTYDNDVNVAGAKYDLTNTAIEAVDGSQSALDLTLTGNTTKGTSITGGVGNDTLTGGTAVDTLIGGNGNDTLFGGNDALIDSLSGGVGNDTYMLKDTKDIITDVNGANTIKFKSDFTASALSLRETVAYNYMTANISTIDASLVVDKTKNFTLTGSSTVATTITGGAGNDTITGGTAIDTLSGGGGNDIINAGSGNDTLYGNAGNDYLDGQLGNDTLFGGLGDDSYVVNDLNDTFTELVNEGNDTLKLSEASGFASFTLDPNLYANIENIDASAIKTSITLNGNSLSNTLIGGYGSDVLFGGKDADVDTLMGGKGSDIYFVKNSFTKVLEDADQGYDKVILSDDFNVTGSSFELVSNVEFLDATSVTKAMTLRGSSGSATSILATNYNDKVYGGSGDDLIYGYDGNDSIYGGAGEDSLYGGDGADYIDGGADRDTLYGGEDTFVDTLVGGDGNDVYMLKDTKDKIVDTVGGSNVRLNHLFKESTFSLANNAGDYDYSATDIMHVEAQWLDQGVTLIGNNTFTTKTTIIPATDTEPAQTITESIGKDIMMYGSGYDDLMVGYSGNDLLQGCFGDSTLYGWGNDTLFGGGGSNTLLGGLGDDTYLIDGTETSAGVTELTDGKIIYGKDTVKLISNDLDGFKTGVNLEKVYSQGSLNKLKTFTIALAENCETLDASLITGTDLTITGNSIKGGDTLIGGGGNDTITGGSDNDTIYGGEGNDSLKGGTGLNILDGGNGDDTYNISVADEESIKGNEWKVEEKEINGVKFLVETIPILKTALHDSSGIDTIVLKGKESYSSEYYEHFSLTLPTDIDNLDASAIAPELRLLIEGNELDNYIIGGTGYDNIHTYGGDDTILDYESWFHKDGTEWITGNHIDAGDGRNTVKTGFGDDSIISLGGDDFIYDLGGDNDIDAGDGDNRVYTSDGHDKITTGTGDDFILAGDGNDTVRAGTGLNTISGGAGDDTYVIDVATDILNESLNAGNDTISISSTSAIATLNLTNYTNIENISGALSSNAISLYGDENNNILTAGKTTNDLYGGLGNDTYVINKLTDNIHEAASAGSDTAKLSSTSILTTLDVTSFTNIENLDGSLSGSNVTLYGDGETNILTGSNQNDLLNGKGGANTLIGGLGDDSYILNGSGDTFTELVGEGNDTLIISTTANTNNVNLTNFANVENLDGSLYGSELTLSGSNGDNILTAGTGANNMFGGAGDDTYIINYNSAIDFIGEGDNAGNDTLKISAISVLNTLDLNDYVNIENIDGSLSGFALTLTGNEFDNILTCNWTSNDLYGGLGNDTYVINQATDFITENFGAGIDTIKLSSTSNIATLDLNDYGNIENLDGSLSTQSLTLTGDGGDNIITSGQNNDVLDGGGGLVDIDEFRFFQGAKKDTINATGNGDKVYISAVTGLNNEDILFYTDASDNLFIDYTDGAVGNDVIEILAGNYADGTSVQIGNSIIDINVVNQYLAGDDGKAFAGLDAQGISDLTKDDKASQFAALSWNQI